MRVDVHQPGLNVGDAVRIVGRFGFVQECRAFEVGLQHDIDQAFRSVGRFLRKTADPPAWGNCDRAAFER